MASHTRRCPPRLTAAMLIAAVGWPSMANAAGGSPPVVEESAAPEPEAKPEPEPARSPEEIEKRRGDLRLEQADIHWLEGDRLYTNGSYAEAAVEFERSYAAIPAAAALYSVALSYERAGKPVQAVRALERYLALADCPPDPSPEQSNIYCTQQRPEAERALADQRRRIGSLELELGEGVELREVRVAGRSVPLEDFPLLLLPGTVDVEVFGLQADERRSRPAYIAPGEVFKLYVAPFDAPTAESAVPAPRVDPVDELRRARSKRQLKSAFWVGTGLTAGSGIALAVTGGLARYNQLRFGDELCPNPCVVVDDQGNEVLDEQGNTIPRGDEQDLYPHDREAAFERYKPIANAMLGVTLGLGVATALVGVFAFRKRDDAPATSRGRARAHVRVGGSGLVVRW